MKNELLQLNHQALYAAFDRFPSRKGAAVHINQMAGTLFDAANGGLLFVLGDDALPAYQREDQVEIVRFSKSIANFLDRTLAYGRALRKLLKAQRDTLKLCHFRDVWSGIAVLEKKNYVTVFEVNALPSIELPYTYPNLAPATLDKIRLAEQFCFVASDAIITPSHSLQENLIKRGVDADKITVIANGATIQPKPPRPANVPERYLIYFGALQRWQGVEVLLRSFARLADLTDLHLVICASTHPRTARAYQKLATKLEIAERLHWFFALEEDELAPLRAHAQLSVAPLIECSRNLEQGCAPLKILESMAAGVPVVASDMPSVREIINDKIDGKLVRPDRPSDLARAIRVMLEYPETLQAMGERARRRIEEHFTWEKSTDELRALYHSLCPELTGKSIA
ncbi:MAG: glycosyltransferase family 4 protein [Acidobacteriota bacterium]